MPDEAAEDFEIEPVDEFEFNEETLALEPEEDDEDSIEVVDATAFDANLAACLEDAVLQEIGSRRQEVLTNLKNSRTEWEENIKRGIKWLGFQPDDNANTPTEDSCTAVVPLLMENTVKFQAKAIQELWPAKGPVRTKIKGHVNFEREQAASRVRTFMNYQLTEQVPGFYNDLERNLFRVALMGTGIRKAGWNEATQAPDPAIVHIENFYVDPVITHLRHADEHIEEMELTPRVMETYEESGRFCCDADEEPAELLQPNDISEAISRAQGFDTALERRGYLIGESHCYLDLEGMDPLIPDGGIAPYIVHFNVKSGRVYSIRRNWRPDDKFRIKRLWYTADQFIPAFGFYGFGFIHLIGDLTASSSAALRALVDAGQFANWQAGFKSKDAKFSNSDKPLEFGEFRDVNLGPDELQKAFLPLPSKEPSQVLFQMLQFMVGMGQKFADATDEVVQNGTNYGPAATTLALLEASQRFYSSIHKRLHQSQHEFFRILAELNYENLPAQVQFVVGDENQFVRNIDFNPQMVDVIPSSDPNALSETQRVAKAQIELEMAARFPQLLDVREALLRFYVAMGTDAPEKLFLNPEQKALTADPLTEIQAAMAGRPIKAQLGQDHSAHIAVKEAFMKQPQMQTPNDPTTATGLQLLKANIAEHKVLIFVAQAAQMAQQAGVPIQNEQVQAQVAQQMLALSAASGGGGGPTIEQQMLELNKQELAVAAERLRSQDTREAAKIAAKNRELDLKEAEFLLEAQDKGVGRQLEAASKVLDNNTKLAQISAKVLAERVKATDAASEGMSRAITQ